MRIILLHVSHAETVKFSLQVLPFDTLRHTYLVRRNICLETAVIIANSFTKILRNLTR